MFPAGKVEWYGDHTRLSEELIVRKLIGLLLMALLTSLSITAIIQYLQVCVPN